MKIIRSPERLRKVLRTLRRRGRMIGFVPTMGALHEGHLSLVRGARCENKVVVVSIFVNPTQFGPGEDFRRYPRTFRKDAALLRKERTDFLFSPSVKAMYPAGCETTVEMARLAKLLCGKFRPGHFRGVATVVAKLFHIVEPDRAYFGAKDYQQSVVVRQLIRDLALGIRLRVLPVVRERDGLAMSSRNRYLSAAERERARAISSTLFWLRGRIRSGEKNLAALKREARRLLRRKVDRLDYLEIVDPETLVGLKRFRSEMIAAVACFVGKTRLIDNVKITALG